MHTYTIRPLEWEYDDEDDTWEAFTINEYPDYMIFRVLGTGFWTLLGPERNQIGYKSDDAAKLAAEAHWQERIKQALVPVTEQNKENA